MIDFEKGKLTGFCVVVQGKPTSELDIGLTFRSVKNTQEIALPSPLRRDQRPPAERVDTVVRLEE